MRAQERREHALGLDLYGGGIAAVGPASSLDNRRARTRRATAGVRAWIDAGTAAPARGPGS